jgi:hypothetical protein
MNTVFSNYPYLREVEVTRPSATVPIQNAFAGQFGNGRPPDFKGSFPFRLECHVDAAPWRQRRSSRLAGGDVHAIPVWPPVQRVQA